MRTVHIVLPNDIDDAASPSGGNVYDRRLCRGLAASGWAVREHAVAGAWPRPSAADRDRLGRVVTALPDDALVVVDGLVASAAPEMLRPEARRLRLVILLHMPLGPGSGERELLSDAADVVTTSHWSRRRVLAWYDLAADRVHCAPPGVDSAPLTPGWATGRRLLCVAAVMPHKGHDRLVEALAAVADRPWTCQLVGPLHRDAEFVDRLRGRIAAHGLARRITLLGPRTGRDLDERYAAADLLVLPSRRETYGMVVTEALARGVPVVATDAGGLPEALGHTPHGRRPGLLVPPDEPAALTHALRRWLDDPVLRQELRRSTLDRRATLAGWDVTAALVGRVLAEAARRVEVTR